MEFFTFYFTEQVHCAPPGALSSTSGPDAGEPSIPPLIFPKDGSGYKVVENETALKILQSRAEAETEQPAPKEKEVKSILTVEFYIDRCWYVMRVGTIVDALDGRLPPYS